MVLFVTQFVLLVGYIRAYENLALSKEAWQEHDWPKKEVDWGAAKAVDGLYTDRTAGGNQCTISNGGQTTATWRVDMGSVVSISHIDIYYRTDGKPSPGAYYDRFAGFFLYVSNTTSNVGGHLCFHEIQNVNGTPIENQTISCSVHGRYVIYYNERLSNPSVPYPSYYSQYAFNELCEVEVQGCHNQTMYGVNCDQQCPDGCQEKRCHISSGYCLGCIPGYQGLRCSQVCDTHTYGLECSSRCGNCSGGDTCHHVNGTCLKGCDEGVQGEECKTECQPGFYGKNCGQTCSENCKVTNRCNRFTGECDGGCKPGWKTPKCQQECDGGMYGVGCIQRCGSCLDNKQCHHVNGTCLNGCSSGYLENLCNKTCGEKFWGPNCRENCSSNCVNETCRHDTGVCYQQKLSGSSADNGSSVVPVVAGVLTAVFVIAIVLAVVFFLRRARSRGRDKAGPHSNGDRRVIQTNVQSQLKASSAEISNLYANTSEIKISSNDSQRVNNAYSDETGGNSKEDDVDMDEKIHEENPYGDLDIKEELVPDIPLSKLEAVIEEKQKDDEDGFKREYATLPYGEKFPCNYGRLPENVVKNRFKTTFPYDHSRVQLNYMSDYINANFIQGVEKNNEYIASQGPKQNTLSDFWAMMWQENVRQIVMLTNLKEGNKAKCVKYWADINEPVTFGVFSLRTIEEKNYAFYIIRKFRVTNEQLKKTHMVTQYHYTAWPDHGTPEPLCLVYFHDHVTRTKDAVNAGPTLVHCSAGIGRTGTYIAIDALHWAGKKDKKINIAEYVKKMREDRMNMVQTYEQYRTIFLALNDMFKAPTAVQTKTQFVQKAEEMRSDEPVNQSDFGREFQTLMKVKPSYTDSDYKIALNSGRERTRILPLDRYSFYLSSSVAKRGNYINAISLPSYENQNAFIVTQYPQPGDAVDLLRLLTDHESDVVICLGAMREVESTKVWLPSTNSSKSVPPFTVHCHQENVTDVKLTTLHVVREGANDEARCITVVEPQYNLQSAGQDTSQILGLVSYALRSRTEGPITVVSRDGATLCGVFCAVHNVLQQLSMDGEIDIFSVVRQLHVRRPELCCSLEEYRMIHDAVLHYVQSREGHVEENIYSNQ